MSDELRATLEAAVEEHSESVQVEPTPAPASSEAAAPVQSSDAPEQSNATPSDQPVEKSAPELPSIEEVASKDGKPVEDKAETPADRQRVDLAPQSWKGDSKKVWAELPLNVRQEVIRREREITKGLNEAAQARQQVSQIQEVIQPHMDRINTIYGGNTIQAINNLMGIERTLASGDPVSKAQLVAKMINHFKVDLVTLDNLLAGAAPTPEVQQQSTIEKLLEQKLAPFQQFIQTQQQREQAKAQQAEQEAINTIESMATDPKFPYFNEVRNDMADLIDIAAKKGLYLSLEQAYTKAVRMNDGTFEASTVRDTSQAATQAALQAHQAAQKAKGAAVSVGGTPSGVGVNAGNPADLRGTILAALGDTGRI